MIEFYCWLIIVGCCVVIENVLINKLKLIKLKGDVLMSNKKNAKEELNRLNEGVIL